MQLHTNYISTLHSSPHSQLVEVCSINLEGGLRFLVDRRGAVSNLSLELSGRPSSVGKSGNTSMILLSTDSMSVSFSSRALIWV